MMRPFLSIVLLCAACGDNLIIDEQEGPPVEEPGLEEPYTHFVPDVCSVRSWPTVAFADRDVDLSVVPTRDGGAAIFSVERTGGPLMGFAIDGRGELVTKEAGNIIRDDRTFTNVSAAYIDERLIAASVTDDGSVMIDMVRPDLGATHNLGAASGMMVADLPMTHFRDHRFAAFADDRGIAGIHYDQAWETTSTQVVTASTPLSMTATRYREDMMIAWSTETSCHLQRVAAQLTSNRNFACINSRIAVSERELRGYMVYEEGDNKVSIADIRVGGHSELANTRLLVESAHSPKIVFDGSRFWVSYVNLRQDVVVGYIGSNGSLVSMALEGTQPYAEGYELAVINGFVWVFAVDGGGANAQRLCLKPLR